MAETRKGTCKDCGAEYQIPASFPHDKAKCRECGGIVEIEPAAGAAPPVPAAEPPAKPAEAPAEKGMTMKEKIIARKKAEAAAKAEAAGEAAEAKPAKKAPAKNAGGAKKAAGTKAGKKATKKAGGRKAAGAKGRRGRGGDDEDGGGRKGRRGAAKQEKKPPVAGIVAILLLVVGGGAGWYFLAGPGAGGDEPEPTTVAQNDPEPETPVEEAPVEEPTTPDPADEQPAEAAEDPDAGAEEAPADPEPAPEKTYDPFEIQYDEYPIFGKFLGTTDEEWEEITGLVDTFADMDAGAAQGRAGNKLTPLGFRAIPAIINKMRDFDLGSEVGNRQGDLFQRKMTELMNGINAGWLYDANEDGSLIDRAHRHNRLVVRTYLKTWNQVVEDPTNWIATAKLGQEKYADQLEEYSAILLEAGVTEGEFFDRVLGAGGGGDLGLDDDDLGLDDF